MCYPEEYLPLSSVVHRNRCPGVKQVRRVSVTREDARCFVLADSKDVLRGVVNDGVQ